MSLQYLNFEAIAESDLARLVVDGVGESKTLEYKEALTLVTDEQKREFLSDITALANTEGGDLVLGMKADKGVAAELVGLRNLVPDDSYGKIENLLRDFLQPRLSGVRIRALALANGNHALLIRAPRSFAAPHMVRHQGVTRFCGRNSSGKYDLDVHELRSAFLASDTLSERLKTFRIERINRLLSGNAPVPLAGDHLLVFHLLPVVGARADTRLTTPSLQRLLSEHTPRPIASSGWTPSLNFDGVLIATNWKDRLYHSYVQILRSGFLEAVEALTLEPTLSQRAGQPPARIIPSIAWEKRIIAAVPSYLKALAELKLPPPYVASISLLNVRDYMMYVGPMYDIGPVQLMNNDLVPDLPAAARHLENATTSLAEAVRALRNPDGAAVLREVGRKFGEMAGHFRNGMLLAGLSVPLVGVGAGARAMGKSKSPKKLEALAKAREALATKRRLEKERRLIGRRRSPGSIG